MKKIYFLLTIITLVSVFRIYSNTEKKLLAQEKLTFINSQKEEFEYLHFRNKCIYKQTQDIARYILKDNFSFIKQQIKSAVKQILSSQEFIDYHHYSVMLKAPLIGRDSIKIKEIPIVRPDRNFSKKINDILAATIPVALLERIEVISYFEAYLNYKMDFADFQFIIAKLNGVEKELEIFLMSLENNN